MADEDNGFTPEPIPDHLADTEVNGLEPVQADETEPVEDTSDDTESDQPEPADEVEETPEAETTEPTEEEAAPTAQEDTQRELTGAERRLAEKAKRDYISDERQKIREYEQEADLDDVTERMRILEARQYVDSVERNRQSIARDANVAKTEIPFFKQGTTQSDILYEQSLRNFADAYGVTDPDTGEWIAAQDRNGKEVQLLPYLQQQAAIYEQAVATAQRQVQQSEAKMRAKAVNPGNTGKAISRNGDDLSDLLDRIGDTPLN